jgi:flagellar biosynthesis/type III secretory pathway chaperone
MAMEAFITILREEHAALVQRESRRLEETTAAKTRQLERLQQLGQERENCFRSLGLADSPRQVHNRLGKDSTLGKHWQQLLELGRQCRKLNRLNGITIELGHRHVSQALRLVSGRDDTPASYGPGGRKQDTPASRLLGQV